MAIQRRVNGRLEVVADVADVTEVSASTSSQQLLAPRADRLGAYFDNESTATLYLKLGSGASATSYTAKLRPGAFYELPTEPLYAGLIHGAWSAANGRVHLTELS